MQTFVPRARSPVYLTACVLRFRRRLEAEQAIKQAVNCPTCCRATVYSETRNFLYYCRVGDRSLVAAKNRGSRVTEVPAPAAPRFSLTDLQVPIHDLVRGQTLPPNLRISPKTRSASTFGHCCDRAEVRGLMCSHHCPDARAPQKLPDKVRTKGAHPARTNCRLEEPPWARHSSQPAGASWRSRWRTKSRLVPPVFDGTISPV
jgi:hypothetical protein